MENRVYDRVIFGGGVMVIKRVRVKKEVKHLEIWRKGSLDVTPQERRK